MKQKSVPGYILFVAALLAMNFLKPGQATMSTSLP
jgi:hypothetical protein